MKLVFGLLFGALLLTASGLREIKTVYVFPMRNSLDQYLVSRLTQEHVFQVVSDPKLADAVFTDSLGPSFEYAFNQRVLEAKVDSNQAPRSYRAGRNTVFLVNKTKEVIWSTYMAPKDSTPKQLKRTSNRVVESLQDELATNPALPLSRAR